MTAGPLYKITQTVQLPGNEMLNRKVLSSRQKVREEGKEKGWEEKGRKRGEEEGRLTLMHGWNGATNWPRAKLVQSCAILMTQFN